MQAGAQIMVGPLKKSSAYWISCIVLLSICSIPAHSQELPKQEPAQPNKTKQGTPAYNRGSNELPVIIEIAPSSRLKIETEHDAEKENSKAYYETLLAKSTVTLAVFTFVLACATIGLMVFTAKLWGATGKLVQGAERNSERQLRAYIFLEGDKDLLKDFIVNGSHGGVEIRLLLKNVGKTPVFKLNHSIGAGIYQFPLNDELPILEVGTNNIYLPPNADLNLVCQWNTVWQTQMLDIDPDSRMRLYVWGEVRYVDAFQNHRFLKFRFMRQRKSGAGLDYCSEGNEAN